MKKIAFKFAAILAGILSAGSASAAIITFTATGLATGAGPTGGFTNTPFMLRAIADTASKRQCVNGSTPIPNCFLLINNSLNISSSSFGSFDLTSPTLSVRNGFGQFSFGEVFRLNPVATRALMVLNINRATPGLDGYDLVSDFGPVTTRSFVQRTDVVPGPIGFHFPIQTTGGSVIITSSSVFDSTFQATLQSVPEPASWAMMISGFGIAGASARYRRTKAKLAFA